MRTLITGIHGFVGDYLYRELHEHSFTVFGITRGSSAERNIYTCDLLDYDRLKEVITATSPEIIFHLAGFTSARESWDKPDEAMRINKDGTRNLYQAASELNKKIKILITSSAEVYGNPRYLPIDEKHPVDPANPYALSKLAQEEISHQYTNIQTIICRSFNHTGPGQNTNFAVPSFAKQIADAKRTGQGEIFVGNLKAIRDFTDVRDVVRAYRLLCLKGHWGQTYNVCSGITYSMEEIVKMLIECSGNKIELKVDPDRLRPVDIPILHGDNSKIKKDTGWIPIIPFRKTLSDIFQSECIV